MDYQMAVSIREGSMILCRVEVEGRTIDYQMAVSIRGESRILCRVGWRGDPWITRWL